MDGLWSFPPSLQINYFLSWKNTLAVAKVVDSFWNDEAWTCISGIDAPGVIDRKSLLLDWNGEKGKIYLQRLMHIWIFVPIAPSFLWHLGTCMSCTHSITAADWWKKEFIPFLSTSVNVEDEYKLWREAWHNVIPFCDNEGSSFGITLSICVL